MPYITRDFTQYVVYYISGSSPSIGVAQDAEIDLFTKDFKRAGIIYFMPDNVPLPTNKKTINGIYLYYRMNRFTEVMTMLKEEKPLHICLETTKKHGYISTSTEPIGEQEGT